MIKEVERVVEKPTIVEKIVEKIVEVKVEVPVEKIEYVDREVIKEIERVVEVERPVEVEKIVEVRYHLSSTISPRRRASRPPLPNACALRGWLASFWTAGAERKGGGGTGRKWQEGPSDSKNNRVCAFGGLWLQLARCLGSV